MNDASWNDLENKAHWEGLSGDALATALKETNQFEREHPELLVEPVCDLLLPDRDWGTIMAIAIKQAA